jgi:hypothetical protein
MCDYFDKTEKLLFKFSKNNPEFISTNPKVDSCDPNDSVKYPIYNLKNINDGCVQQIDSSTFYFSKNGPPFITTNLNIDSNDLDDKNDIMKDFVRYPIHNLKNKRIDDKVGDDYVEHVGQNIYKQSLNISDYFDKSENSRFKFSKNDPQFITNNVTVESGDSNDKNNIIHDFVKRPIYNLKNKQIGYKVSDDYVQKVGKNLYKQSFYMCDYFDKNENVSKNVSKNGSKNGSESLKFKFSRNDPQFRSTNVVVNPSLTNNIMHYFVKCPIYNLKNKMIGYKVSDDYVQQVGKDRYVVRLNNTYTFILNGEELGSISWQYVFTNKTNSNYYPVNIPAKSSIIAGTGLFLNALGNVTLVAKPNGDRYVDIKFNNV